jgi:hypothetical protein
MKNILIILFSLFAFAVNAQHGIDDNRFYYGNEFTVPIAATSSVGILMTASGTNAANASTDATTASTIGIMSSSTGTTNSGRVCNASHSGAVKLGNGSWLYKLRIDSIADLSRAANGYALLVGFFDTYTAANQVDGVYFLYDSLGTSTGSASSDRWQTVTSNNSSRTFFETSTDVVLTGTTLEIQVSYDGTTAEFFIDGVSVKSETLTIPVNRALGFGYMIIKSAGTTASLVYVDHITATCGYNRTN